MNVIHCGRLLDQRWEQLGPQAMDCGRGDVLVSVVTLLDASPPQHRHSRAPPLPVTRQRPAPVYTENRAAVHASWSGSGRAPTSSGQRPAWKSSDLSPFGVARRPVRFVESMHTTGGRFDDLPTAHQHTPPGQLRPARRRETWAQIRHAWKHMTQSTLIIDLRSGVALFAWVPWLQAVCT